MNLAFSNFAFEKFLIWRTCQSTNCNCVPGAWVQPEAASGKLLISNFLLRNIFLQYMPIYFNICQYISIYSNIIQYILPPSLSFPGSWRRQQRRLVDLRASPSKELHCPSRHSHHLNHHHDDASCLCQYWYFHWLSLSVARLSSWLNTHFESLNQSTSALTRMFS